MSAHNVRMRDIHNFSALLKFRELRTYLRFMNDLEDKLSYKKTPQGQNLVGLPFPLVIGVGGVGDRRIISILIMTSI